MNRSTWPSLNALIFLTAAVVSTNGSAQSLDPFNFGVTAEQRYDSNLFLLPDHVQPGGNGNRAVSSEYVTASTSLSKSYGLQHVSLDASISRDFYNGYRYLDYTGNKVAFTYNWSVTPELSGNVIVQHSNQPTDFAYSAYQTRPNPTKSELRRLDIDLRPGAAVHPRFSVIQVEDLTSQPVFQQQNVKSTSVEISLVYEFRSGNTAELYFRRAPGSYDGQFEQNAATLNDPEFSEREVGVRANWQFSGASKLQGSLGYLDQTHRTYAARDFDGLVGNINYLYAFTGKSSVQASAGRSLGSSQTLFSSYVLDENLSVGPVYAASGKVTIRPSVSISRRTFRGSPFPVAADLRYVSRSGNLAIDYAALRALDLSINFSTSNRTSNDATYQYRDRSAVLTGRFKF